MFFQNFFYIRIRFYCIVWLPSCKACESLVLKVQQVLIIIFLISTFESQFLRSKGKLILIPAHMTHINMLITTCPKTITALVELRLKKHSLSRYNCDRIKPRFQILQIFCITVYSTLHITRKKKPVF
jgi:hypothetical protein